MRIKLLGSIVFDTGVLVEVAAGTSIGKLAYEILVENEVIAVTTRLNLVELKYILVEK